jgi:acetolactate synthase-1/2/3 large subunit
VKASDLLVRCLENEGVKYVFGIPGEEILDIMDSLLDSQIRFIAARHEQGAAFMADAYGRLSGHAGVCLSTLGPGATNLATGIADANLDRSPLVAITGQAGRDRLHKESHQYIDTVEFLRPITKWNTRVDTAVVVPEVVRKAFKMAQTEKPGACHLEVPEDVAEEEVEGTPLSSLRARRPSPDRPSLAAAAQLIEAAAFPLIFAGNGVIRGRASKELRAFSGRHGIPVVHTFMAKGCVPHDDELCLTVAGLQARDFISCGFDKADLIITVGYDPVEYEPRFWNPERKKNIVHIDFTPAEVDSFYEPAVEVVADVRETLELLNDLIKGEKDSAPFRALRRLILEQLEEGADDDAFPLTPQRILRDLRAVMDRDDILISDVGTHKLWIARAFPAYEPNTVIISKWICGDGIRAAGGGGGQAGPPGTEGGCGQWRRRLPDELSGAGDGPAAGAADCECHFSRRRVQPHRLEAAHPLRARVRRVLRQSRFCCPGWGLWCPRLSGRCCPRASTGSGGRLGLFRPQHRRRACGLQRKHEAHGEHGADRLSDLVARVQR